MQTVFIYLTACFLFFNNQNEVPYSSIERAFIANNAEAIVQLGDFRVTLHFIKIDAEFKIERLIIEKT
jgi:hypothetical protein